MTKKETGETQRKMNDRSLRSGMFRVFIANIISLTISLLTSFILPKYLSVDAYAGIKTFQLYLTYIGVLHFGYEDGMYLKYGGKTIEDIESGDILTNRFTLFIFQVVISGIMISISLLLRDFILLAFSVAIVPVNLIAYYSLLFQSVGEFGRYGKIQNWTSFITFFINLILVLIVKTDNHLIYISCYVLWDIILCCVLSVYLKKIVPIGNAHVQFSLSEIKENIRKGLPLTLGNFSSVLLTSVDRWFVKYNLFVLDFAQYSFAVSMENFVNVALTPITVTLYNYFCRHNNTQIMVKMRNTVLIFASYVVACAFGVKLIIELFLSKYMGSIMVMFILFSSQICYVVIKGIYVNVYKSQGRQKQYFEKLIVVILFGIITNIVFFQIKHIKEAYAFATLLSSIVWLGLCLLDYKEIPMGIKEWIYLICSIASFIICGFILSSIMGFIAYMIFVVILGKITMPYEQKFLFQIAIGYFSSYKKKNTH